MKEQTPAHYIVNVCSFFTGYLIYFVRTTVGELGFLARSEKDHF